MDEAYAYQGEGSGIIIYLAGSSGQGDKEAFPSFTRNDKAAN